MPAKRRYKKKPRKQTKYGKPFLRTNGMKLSRTMNPFPTNYVCKLRYSQVLPLTSGVGSWGYQRFQLNNLYDPDYSGVGHQPRGYDEITAIYQRYLVLGAKIKLKILQTTSQNAYVGFTVRKDASAPLIFEDWTEGRYGSSKLLKSNDTSTHTKQLSIRMQDFFGKKMKLTDDNACTDFTSNPVDICNFVIGVNDIDLLSTVGLKIEAEIIYDCIFTKRKYLSSS